VSYRPPVPATCSSVKLLQGGAAAFARIVREVSRRWNAALRCFCPVALILVAEVLFHVFAMRPT
jgi:type II secretory pathway component PulL